MGSLTEVTKRCTMKDIGMQLEMAEAAKRLAYSHMVRITLTFGNPAQRSESCSIIRIRRQGVQY